MRNKLLYVNFQVAKNKVELATEAILPRDGVHVLKISTNELDSVSDTNLKIAESLAGF